MVNQRAIKAIITLSAVTICGLILYTTFAPKNSVIEGKSRFPALDIVSGDITNKGTEEVITSLQVFAPQAPDLQKFVIKKDSYRKSYSPNGLDYSLGFILTTSQSQWNYKIENSYKNGQFESLVISCVDSNGAFVATKTCAPSTGGGEL